MPWPKASSTPTSNPNARHPAAVPSSDTVRRTALSASWARDRRVARRRLAFRWLFWAWWRIGLPVLLTLALAVWLLGQMPPANVPAWLKPVAASIPFNLSNSREQSPAPTSLPSENAPHGKEP
jgi:hypothetical protein